jgi:hypothetical protein
MIETLLTVAGPLFPVLLWLALQAEDARQRQEAIMAKPPRKPPAAPARAQAAQPRVGHPPAAPERLSAPESPHVPLVANDKPLLANAVSSTYRHRDPARRRAYMASYMRDYRARKAQKRRQARGSAASFRPAAEAL